MEGIIGLLFWALVILLVARSKAKKNANSSSSQSSNPANYPSQVQSYVQNHIAQAQSHVAQAPDYASSQKDYTKQMQVRFDPQTGAPVAEVKKEVPPHRTTRPAPPKTPKAVAPQMKQSAKPEIVKRAKGNVNKYASDTTLEQLEAEHKHSEKVSSAEAAYVKKEADLHAAYHSAAKPSIEEESLLGSVEDLMVKGYDGNLSFSRDFVAEGMDMINRFVV